MNNLAMFGGNSSHEDEVGRHGISCCTKFKASMARNGLVGAIGVSGGGISYGVGGTMAEATKDRMSFGKGGTVGISIFSPKSPPHIMQISELVNDMLSIITQIHDNNTLESVKRWLYFSVRDQFIGT